MKSAASRAPDLREDSIVYVIDDDASMRSALSGLLRSAGFEVFAFERIGEFTAFPKTDAPSCLLLDVRLRGESGLTYQREACRQPFHIPIILLTAHGDIEMSVQAMKEGAADFLTKPVKDQRLIDAVVAAHTTDASLKVLQRRRAAIQALYDLLTRREREVIHHVVDGMLNKQIAAAMQLSEITVKIHRSAAMRKLLAASVADLVRKMETLRASSNARG
ncbi:response regulator transcription factor [Paraburkholderia strydomiana]|jgi:FixJ family two-component response regulator|uniref:response regulator transcription factor n=1 Tax=Paraburkholderia strydomiana TaxID=1245417 RepID=UPI0038BC0AB9